MPVRHNKLGYKWLFSPIVLRNGLINKAKNYHKPVYCENMDGTGSLFIKEERKYANDSYVDNIIKFPSK